MKLNKADDNQTTLYDIASNACTHLLGLGYAYVCAPETVEDDDTIPIVISIFTKDGVHPSTRDVLAKLEQFDLTVVDTSEHTVIHVNVKRKR